MRILRGVIIALLVSVLLVAGLIVLMIESEPVVDVKAAEQVADADTVHELLAQLESSVSDRHQGHTITITTQQFDSIVGFLQRATPDFRGKVTVHPDATRLQASIAIPVDLFDSYLNVDATILPANFLLLDEVKIGDLHIPGHLAVGLAEWLVNRWTKSDIATQAREQIEKVSMTEQEMMVSLRPMDGFLRNLNEVKNGLSVDQDDELRDLTAYYLRYISFQDITLADTPQPAVDFIRLTMKRAAQRSTPENATEHNRAAILALAIFIGHHRVANFVGDVQPDADKALKPLTPPLLRGRNDLARHFLISAALKVLSEQGVTLAIGEFKELMDRAMGGSGYSFVDLTADMAGIEFARVATSPVHAVRVQQLLSEMHDDDVIMPPVDGLAEGLSKDQFIEQFERVDSDAYLQEVAKIKARLATVPLYQLEDN
ncbi:hypothetical protein Q4520_10295 [Alteromonas sp. 1_MG-2023]|uniref:hypothetical protein n=1 Tax=Alteromonas sp. 1_MG-2023 TaxID=3062669 RepID=UPI0026E3F565|nr:hypothetical protein [Alteromonas sp. 1_MG-2023]MDO6475816.1 hypothetical protein [Alteromonas sp. 1_MG-2023]